MLIRKNAFSETILHSIGKNKIHDGEYILFENPLEMSLSSHELFEGEQAATLELNLSARPLHDVTINFHTDNLIFDNSEIVFTSSNWDQPQSIAINTPNNDTYDGDKEHNI